MKDVNGWTLKEGCMQLAAMSGGGRLNFWDAITSKGTGCFLIYKENTNRDVFLRHSR